MDDTESPERDYFRKYVPAGCLRIVDLAAELGEEEWPSRSDDETMAPLEPDWRAFAQSGESRTVKNGSTYSHIDSSIQKALLRTATLKPYAGLCRKRWVMFEAAISSDNSNEAIIRVYLLPHDVDRALIERQEKASTEAFKKLVAALDFSSEAWQGISTSTSIIGPRPDLTASSDDQGDPSLLQMFNTIPAPSPDPSVVKYDLLQETIHRILASNIPGLKTQLYAYQTRSAAIMLQRETEPGRIIDPRLMQLFDQHGETFYYDDHEGTLLKEPRLYDCPSGGILAEEMGTGKTLICLSLILATKDFPAETPEIYKDSSPPVRPQLASLIDMAASVAVRESVPWKLYFQSSQEDESYDHCVAAMRKQQELRGYYLKPHLQDTRRQQRSKLREIPPVKIHLSNSTLIIVPNNLIKQWQAEVNKHTEGLRVLLWPKSDEATPTTQMIIESDIVLIGQGIFEQLNSKREISERGYALNSPLAEVQFKRVIVDEGHKLGNSRMSKKSNTLLILECLHVSSRWIVTGTPSTGLFGVDNAATASSNPASPTSPKSPATARIGDKLSRSSTLQEKHDLEQIGAMASLYLKVRPWANTVQESGDTPADWSIYVMQKKHNPKSRDRKDCLRATLNSLIIRHPLSEVTLMLPEVDEKVTVLDGCYQDKLCLNLFSMMIIFNAVQSQRKDQDYFFHSKQRSAVLQLVSNLQQSTFFGGSFFPPEVLQQAIETATKFIEEGKIETSKEDDSLLRSALAFGLDAVQNRLKSLAAMFHEMPLYVENFPGGEEMGKAWSLDGQGEGPICTNAPMLHALQTIIAPHVDDPWYLECRFNDGFFTRSGQNELAKIQKQDEPGVESDTASPSKAKGGTEEAALAGSTTVGSDKVQITHRSGALGTPSRMDHIPAPEDVAEKRIAEPLSRARIVSTASAKLSYLIDSIVKHQEDEQMIVFFENENVAFYLAEHLEILNIHHLIYARGITAERRAQYIDTFNNNPKFRVLLMDITQGAFGIDVRSASRVYFINPVLNPQVEAQAIGRVRRISQKRHVSVETLVLKGSLEEVIMDRRKMMTQAEHRRCKTILDDKAIYEWILNPKIMEMPRGEDGEEMKDREQMAPLKTPQLIFGRGFGKIEHPDEDLVPTSPDARLGKDKDKADLSALTAGVKRGIDDDDEEEAGEAPQTPTHKPKKVRRIVRFAD